MPTAASITNKVDSILKKFAPPLFTVYKRVVVRTGGDSLIGRPGSVTNTDTILAPQPIYARGMRRQVGGSDAMDVDVVGGVRIAESYEMTVSVNAMSEADLQNQDVFLRFLDPSGVEEIYRIVDYEPIAMQGQNICWLVYVMSTKR